MIHAIACRLTKVTNFLDVTIVLLGENWEAFEYLEERDLLPIMEE